MSSQVSEMYQTNFQINPMTQTGDIKGTFNLPDIALFGFQRELEGLQKYT